MATHTNLMEWNDDERDIRHVKRYVPSSRRFQSPVKLKPISQVLKEFYQREAEKFRGHSQFRSCSNDNFNQSEYCTYQSPYHTHTDRNLSWVDEVIPDEVEAVEAHTPESSHDLPHESAHEPIPETPVDDVIDDMIYRKFCYT